MQNDQVFQNCTLKKYDGGLYLHLSGLPKTLSSPKNSGRGVTTNYPSAFDQAAFAKFDCLKT